VRRKIDTALQNIAAGFSLRFLDMIIREKQHRLLERNYQGEVSVSFTICIKDRVQLFKSPSAVNVFINILKSQVKESSCIIPVYCFMPDHQHLIVTGTDSTSEVLDFFKAYKQKTGYWLSQNLSSASWQKDFLTILLEKMKVWSTLPGIFLIIR
jgi:REP element-mobilizing transposase RayT